MPVDKALETAALPSLGLTYGRKADLSTGVLEPQLAPGNRQGSLSAGTRDVPTYGLAGRPSVQLLSKSVLAPKWNTADFWKTVASSVKSAAPVILAQAR